MNLLATIFAAEDLGTIEGEGLGPLGRPGVVGDAAAGLGKVADVVSAIIGVMTIAASIWFIFQFLVGGFNWITSGGDKGKLTEARDRITNAFVGLIIVVAGWSILALTGKFLNLDVLLTDPSGIINSLNIGQ